MQEKSIFSFDLPPFLFLTGLRRKIRDDFGSRKGHLMNQNHRKHNIYSK